MKLRDTAEVWFSELEDNWEECDFFWFSRSLRNDDRYRRYGDLPDGSRFGTAFIPASGDPWEREAAIVIVGEDGELQRDTPSWAEEGNSSLIAVAMTVPCGECDEATARSLLGYAKPPVRDGAPTIRSGFLSRSGEAIFAVAIQERDVTPPAINAAFAVLWQIATEFGGPR